MHVMCILCSGKSLNELETVLLYDFRFDSISLLQNPRAIMVAQRMPIEDIGAPKSSAEKYLRNRGVFESIAVCMKLNPGKVITEAE